MENELVTAGTKVSQDGIKFREVTVDEVSDSGKAVQNELCATLAEVRNLVANAVQATGNDPFSFGLDCACADPTSVSFLVEEVLKNFTLVKKEEK